MTRVNVRWYPNEAAYLLQLITSRREILYKVIGMCKFVQLSDRVGPSFLSISEDCLFHQREVIYMNDLLNAEIFLTKLHVEGIKDKL